MISHDELLAAYAADKRWRAANKAVEAASARRSLLPPGSSRARVTTANAKWSIKCEERTRIEREIRERMESQRGAL